jgi:hypothetical protein
MEAVSRRLLVLAVWAALPALACSGSVEQPAPDVSGPGGGGGPAPGPERGPCASYADFETCCATNSDGGKLHYSCLWMHAEGSFPGACVGAGADDQCVTSADSCPAGWHCFEQELNGQSGCGGIALDPVYSGICVDDQGKPSP